MDHLDHGGEAVGGAGGGSDQRLRPVIEVVVDAIDDVQRAAVLDRGGDDDLLDPGLEVGGEFGGGLEDAGAVDHDIDAGEGQRRDRLLMGEGDGLAVQDQRVFGGGDGGAPTAVDRVEFHQQCVLCGIACGVVQEDDVAARTGVDQVTQDQFADAAKAVEGDAGHGRSALVGTSRPMASTRDWRERRLRPSNGSSTKAAIRRRSAA